MLARVPSAATIPSLTPLQSFLTLRDWRRDRFETLRRAARTWGDVGELRLPRGRAFLVASAEVAHAMLVEHPDVFRKSLGLRRFARPLLGDGLLTSEHDHHRRQRRLIAPAFAARRIAGYASTMADIAERAEARWAEGALVDVADEMMRLTLAIVARTLFDASVDDEAGDLGRALTSAQEHVTGQMSRLLRAPDGWPTPRNLRFRRSIARLDATVYRMIAERRASGEDRGDVLSMLLLAQEEAAPGAAPGARMSDLQVRDEAMTLFLAGHETTANALAWAFHLVAEHPEVERRLCDEVDRVLGGRTPGHEDLPRLPYVRQVLLEAMRLYPPAYIIGRQAERDVELAGVPVPAGAFVFVNILGMQRRAEYFADPERFDPDRFAPEREKQMPRGAYLPFASGPRVCVGNHFALLEGQIVLATLAQRVRFEPLRPGRIAPEPLMTLRPRGGVPVRVRRRDVARRADVA